MPIFKAIGFGVLILVLGWLVPEVLAELKATAISFLTGARTSADVATSLVSAAGAARPDSIPLSALPSYPLPQAPTYNP